MHVQMVAMQLQSQQNNLELAAAQHTTRMQEWTREVINAEYTSQQEMTQKMIFAEERFEHESRQNTLRCHEEVRDYTQK